MKPLWTPWSMEHLLGQAPVLEHCLFEPPGSAPHAARDLLLYRDSAVPCLLNRYPYANGHLLPEFQFLYRSWQSALNTSP